MVVKVFKEVDVNNDGKLSYDEFKKAVENQQILVSCFVHYKSAIFILIINFVDL